MVEKKKSELPKLGDGDAGAGFDDMAAQLVTVSHGIYHESLPVSGMTVGEVRKRYSSRMDIDPESVAEINGQQVGDDTKVEAGQMLLFAKHAGEKGV